MRILLLLVTSLALAGCLGHSTPPSGWTNSVVEPGRIQTFVDPNGTFFPDDWRNDAVIGEGNFKRADSLLNAVAGDITPARRQALHEYEARWLATVSRTVAGKSRVFILIHGFNDPAESARESYALIREQLDLRADDAVIEFYWDGLKTWGGPVRRTAGSARIWFWATAYSQVGGSRGLRRILSVIHDADVYLISHSRGASVSLSALSNPAYDPDFSRPTERFLCPDGEARPRGAEDCSPGFLSPPALADQRNRYHLLMMAPAIGNPDFWASGAEGPPVREISPWPFEIRYTVNPNDPVLRKYLEALSPHFNATDFGYNADVGRRLSEQYPMIAYPIADLPTHSFPAYVRCRVTLRMFAEAGIASPISEAVDQTLC